MVNEHRVWVFFLVSTCAPPSSLLSSWLSGLFLILSHHLLLTWLLWTLRHPWPRVWEKVREIKAHKGMNCYSFYSHNLHSYPTRQRFNCHLTFPSLEEEQVLKEAGVWAVGFVPPISFLSLTPSFFLSLATLFQFYKFFGKIKQYVRQGYRWPLWCGINFWKETIVRSQHWVTACLREALWNKSWDWTAVCRKDSLCESCRGHEKSVMAAGLKYHPFDLTWSWINCLLHQAQKKTEI